MIDEKEIPEELVKAVNDAHRPWHYTDNMNYTNADKKWAIKVIKEAIHTIHSLMNKGVDPAEKQTGHSSNHYIEILDWMGLDADWESFFAELCNQTYSQKEIFYLYIDGKKDQVFANFDDAKNEADIIYSYGNFTDSVKVKDEKGEVFYDPSEYDEEDESYEPIMYNVFFDSVSGKEWYYLHTFRTLEDAKDYVCKDTGNYKIKNSFGELILDTDDIEKLRQERSNISESTNIFESFLGNRQKGGFDAAKVVRNLKDGRYDSENVIAACVSALEERQKSALAQKLVKQLQSDGILAKVFKRSGEFGTKEQQ